MALGLIFVILFTTFRSIRQALKDSASVGEVCGALREVFGEYQPEI